MRNKKSSIAVVYLARGAEVDWLEAFQRFLASYRKFDAEQDHVLYVVYKGFGSDAHMAPALRWFSGVNAHAIKVGDDRLDIGAYLAAVNEIAEDYVCFLNTYSELLGPAWLKKLTLHIDRPEIGLVGATGSFESLAGLDPRFPAFPSPHIRSNGFMVRRQLFNELVGTVVIREKLDAYFFESGPLGLTRQILAHGLQVLVVGRNGRGYPSRWWPSSGTFRQGKQENLLIGDNQTRAYMAATWSTKRAMVESTWGGYVDSYNAMNA
jgi:hypothetical protein